MQSVEQIGICLCLSAGTLLTAAATSEGPVHSLRVLSFRLHTSILGENYA